MSTRPTSRAGRASEAWVTLLALVCSIHLGCHGNAGSQALSTNVASASGSGAPGTTAAPNGPEADAELVGELLKDPLFVKASASHDPVDLAALGEKTGASSLVRAVADPSSRPTALSAIPYCRDSDLALRQLASSARARAAGDEAFDLLDAMALALEKPNRVGELLDADGIHAAVIDLIEIAKTDGRSERQRALAVTILGRLADRGFVSRAQIPPL